MKSKFVFAALAAILTTAPALPALSHPGHTSPEPATAAPQRAEGTGVIKGVDAKAGTVTIAHEPIAALKWPAMLMKFKVTQASVLNGVTVGRKVHFVLQNQGGKPVVAQIHGL